ncbi:tRNA (adenosine(37)-N6)-threonylcarbamoyltransferase complex dimerization subunit type 1 TsaB [Geochorda subterranea]|uniref:tRNA (Adenosine(37)-N6)-threonylcarbamoyltransferase complex dimerization subunit type 1 TsaB n=1 Tax=Geochorda subterranea TaxID=3109564 RepID=A0ABZ1BN26_9FIRM|nr:tRNA (adenosine(37)-N6)-threonylcarbamoyltransferase complex dimerization subunit type 1 TsaB [Limnochorda sp. LNt]WRP13910.1 tRNA (adenosine(37)-N6)-threonylcarbamoyltransferase complex dimerization subunit type 1 TsaB [Limnochorda sp. LNt]
MSGGRILAIDTATRTLGVALGGEAGWWLSSAHPGGGGRGEAIVEVIRRGLAEAGWRGADLDGVAVAAGPGSYTGLRIGLAVAKALAWAWELPLVGVDTLMAMALAAGWAAPWWWRPSTPGGRGLRRRLRRAAEPPVAALEPARAMPVEELAEAARRHARDRGVTVAAAVGDGCHRYAQTLARLSELEYIWVPEACQLARPVAVGRLGGWSLSEGRRDDPLTLGARYLKATEAERRWQQPPRSP